jgi:TRAP-type C4-dicarboxylate transport system permease small subunit
MTPPPPRPPPRGPPPPDHPSYPAAAARIFRTILTLAVFGSAVAFLWAGWQTAAGFALGAAISALNFHWLRQLVDALGAAIENPAPPRKRAVVLGFRYLLLGGGAYVIVKLIPISLAAVLAGVFVLTAAVFVEAAFEIYYARK